MNGRTLRDVARSVQLAVMAVPGTTIVEAAVEARRRQASAATTSPLLRKAGASA